MENDLTDEVSEAVMRRRPRDLPGPVALYPEPRPAPFHGLLVLVGVQPVLSFRDVKRAGHHVALFLPPRKVQR